MKALLSHLTRRPKYLCIIVYLADPSGRAFEDVSLDRWTDLRVRGLFAAPMHLGLK
jgi:hypothetical protein